MAATWDRNLTFQRGAAMGAEFRGKGVNVALGPMMNMVWPGFVIDNLIPTNLMLSIGKSCRGRTKLGGLWS